MAETARRVIAANVGAIDRTVNLIGKAVEG
jgi:hypothetical protein